MKIACNYLAQVDLINLFSWVIIFTIIYTCCNTCIIRIEDSGYNDTQVCIAQKDKILVSKVRFGVCMRGLDIFHYFFVFWSWIGGKVAIFGHIFKLWKSLHNVSLKMAKKWPQRHSLQNTKTKTGVWAKKKWVIWPYQVKLFKFL